MLFVAYRLHKPGKDYSSLTRAIENLSGTYCDAMTSLTFLDTTLTAAQAWNILKPHIDANDDMLVGQVTASSLIGQINNGVARTWVNARV